MSFLLFLRGLIGVLVVFAIATYAITQSAWTTFINTLICAVIIQVGYFIAILFMIGHTKPAAEAVARNEIVPAAAKENQPESEVAPLPGVRRSPLP